MKALFEKLTARDHRDDGNIFVGAAIGLIIAAAVWVPIITAAL